MGTPSSRAKLLRYLLITIGTLSLVLGILGVFLPLLPTTPFLLLTAACYVRSSDRLYHWLMNHRWFGKYIRDYREKRSIPSKVKYTSLAMIWGFYLMNALLFLYEKPIVLIIYFAVMVAVSYHILSFKSHSNNE